MFKFKRNKKAKLTSVSTGMRDLREPEFQPSFSVRPERVERMEIVLRFNPQQFHDNQEFIRAVQAVAKLPYVGPLDNYCLTVDFDMIYHGLVSQLEGLRVLLAKPEILVNSHLSERDGRPMLFVELIDQLRATERLLALRKNA